VLFAGYAPVHFLCFRPLFERLCEMPAVDVRLSGGLRTRSEKETTFDDVALYRPLGVPEDRVIPIEQMRQEDFDVLFAANTKMLLPRSVGRRVQIFHGISFRNRAIRSANMACDHYFLTGPYMRRRFARGGLLPAGDPRGLRIGFMKTDALVDGSLDRSVLLETFGLAADRPVIAYCPTGQKANSLAVMGEEVLRTLKATNEYAILIKLHDHPHGDDTDWKARLAPLEDEHFKVVSELDVIRVLYVADLLMTDASSVSSEFSLLDRPMVFLDTPRLIQNATRKEESMVDEVTWGRRAGRIVKQPSDVVATVELSLTRPETHAEIRQAMAADLFYNPGRATEAALEWFKQELALELSAKTLSG